MSDDRTDWWRYPWRYHHCAALDDHEFAMFDPTSPSVVRWFHMNHTQPGWMEVFPTVDDAKAAIELFVAGLDIVPWDE